MTRIYIKTFGCKSNFAELFNSFLDINISNVDIIQVKKIDQLINAESNDLVIINTCIVTQTAEKECMTTIKRINNRYPNLNVYLTGCLINSEQLKNEVSTLLGNKCQIIDSCKLIELIKTTLVINETPKLLSVSPGFMSHTRGFLKIQDGCRCYCNYCIVPYVRPWCSVPIDTVIKRFKQMITSGYKEIVLTGINIGAYGIAPGAGTQITFIELLTQLLDISSNKARIRISSIEPEDIDNDFLALFNRYKNLCPHLHLPLQSGSDKVLSEMNRKCTRSKYINSVNRFRNGAYDRVVSADILIGYPTETEDDFLQTLSLISELKLERVHIFTYSPRPGTPASKLIPIQREILLDRKKRIFEYTRLITNDGWTRFINCKTVVISEEQHSTYTVGIGNSYQQVKICPAVPIGQMFEVELSTYDEPWFIGKKIG